MRPRASRFLRVRAVNVNGQPSVCVWLTKLGVRLSTDDEVALLGFVHHYLATWAARAAAGDVAPPVGGFTYGWDGSTLEIPVLEPDAQAVRTAVRNILTRPEAGHEDPTPNRLRESA